MSINKEVSLRLYRTMVTIRAFEEKGIPETQKRGVGGALHSSVGQEAVAAGVCAHLSNQDYIGSTHRGHGHCIAKGVEPRRMMAELFGRVTGSNKAKGGSMHIADMSKGMLGTNGVVGTAIPLALGAGLTSKIKDLGRVAVSFFGDGGVNEGVLHECMNLAMIWRLPVIFCCENNHYAISTPIEYSFSGTTIADRAAAYGMPGVVVDGMDVAAVYETAAEAIARARAGEGPSLLECRTYRFAGHTVADDPKAYRSEDEERQWKSRDPIQKFRDDILLLGDIDAADLELIDKEVKILINEAITFADSSPFPEPSELYEDVYVNYPIEELKRGAHMGR